MKAMFSTGAAVLLASAVAQPVQAHDGHVQDLTTEQQIAINIYEDIIAFRTARGHQQVPAMVNYLTAWLKGEGFADEDVKVTDYDSDGEPTQAWSCAIAVTGRPARNRSFCWRIWMWSMRCQRIGSAHRSS